MICWVCAGLAYWGALAALAICAALHALGTLHRGPRLPRGISQPAR